MKKKLFGMLLAATLILAQTVTVFAEGSKETNVSGVSGVTSVTEGYTVDKGAASSVENSALTDEQKAAATEQIGKANQGDLSAIADTLSGDDKDIVNDANTKALTPVFNVEGKPGSVTFTLTSVPKNVKAVYALHFNTKSGKWELLPGKLDGNKVTVKFSSLSPVIIIAQTEDESSSGGKKHHSSSGDDSSAASGSTAAADGSTVVSPKTGVTSDWTMWIGAAALLFAVSGIMFRKTSA